MTVADELLPTPADVERFEADGAIVLRGLFKDWVNGLRAGVERVMANPSPLEKVYQPKGDSAPFFQDFCNWSRIEEFSGFVFESAAAAAAARLMRSNRVRFFHDHILVKEPGTSVISPWHHDLPYYSVAGQQSVSFWIPLDNVPKASSLECLAGSHRWSISKPKRFDGTDLYEGDDTDELPDIDQDRSSYEILSWEMEPGDAVAFNFRTVHGASANTTRTNRRRVFSARWVGDDAVFVDRKGKSSPPFGHIRLQTGEPLNGPDFPVVKCR